MDANNNVSGNSENPVFNLAVNIINSSSDQLPFLYYLIQDPTQEEKEEKLYQNFLQNAEWQRLIAEEQAIKQVVSGLRKNIAGLERRADSRANSVKDYLLGGQSEGYEKQLRVQVTKLLSNNFRREVDQSVIESILNNAVTIYQESAQDQIDELASAQSECDTWVPNNETYHSHETVHANLIEKIDERIKFLKVLLLDRKARLGELFSDVLEFNKQRDKKEAGFLILCKENLEESELTNTLTMLSLSDIDQQGKTLFHKAVELNQPKALGELIRIGKEFGLNIDDLLIIQDKEKSTVIDEITKNIQFEMLKVVAPFLTKEVRHDMLRKFVKALLRDKYKNSVMDFQSNENCWPLVLLHQIVNSKKDEKDLIDLINMIINANGLYEYYIAKEKEEIAADFLAVQDQNIVIMMFKNLFEALLSYNESDVGEFTPNNLQKKIINPFLNKLSAAITDLVKYENRKQNASRSSEGLEAQIESLVNLSELEEYYLNFFEIISTPSDPDELEEIFTDAVRLRIQGSMAKFSLSNEQIATIDKLIRTEFKKINLLFKLSPRPEWMTVDWRFNKFRKNLLESINAYPASFELGSAEVKRVKKIEDDFFTQYVNWNAACVDNMENQIDCLQNLSGYITKLLELPVKPALKSNLLGMLDEVKIGVSEDQVLGAGFISSGRCYGKDGNLAHILFQYMANMGHEKKALLEPLLNIAKNGTDLFFEDSKGRIPVDFLCKEEIIKDGTNREIIEKVLSHMVWQIQFELALWGKHLTNEEQDEVTHQSICSVSSLLTHMIEKLKLEDSRAIERLEISVLCLSAFYKGVKQKSGIEIYNAIAYLEKPQGLDLFARDDFWSVFEKIKEMLAESFLSKKKNHSPLAPLKFFRRRGDSDASSSVGVPTPSSKNTMDRFL